MNEYIFLKNEKENLRNQTARMHIEMENLKSDYQKSEFILKSIGENSKTENSKIGIYSDAGLVIRTILKFLELKIFQLKRLVS